MNIPNKVKVGGITYKVRVVAPEEMEEKTGGMISTERCWIKVLKAETPFMEQTFLHELLHAINMELGEETTEFLAQALYQVIVDNPRIFEGKNK